VSNAVVRALFHEQAILVAAGYRERMSEPFLVSGPCERIVRHTQGNFMRFSAITMISQAACATSPKAGVVRLYLPDVRIDMRPI
jgi:hypothetical protein